MVIFLSQEQADFEEPLQMFVDCRAMAYGSLQRVESKAAALIAGTLAVIDLMLDRGSLSFDKALAVAYISAPRACR